MARILIVDNDPEIRQAFTAALAPLKYAVRSCLSGNEAIELYEKERADLVFCDLKLEGVDGMVVLETLKAMDPWATVIMVTAYGTVDAATRALRLGAYDFIEKPCTVTQLKEITQRALEHRRRLKEVTRLQGKPGTAADIPTRLVELEQLKADFLTMVVEELRTPLRHLNEALALAADGFYGPWEEPLKKQFLERISRVENSLSRLFLASFSLFLAHEQRVTPTDGDLAALAGEIIREAQARCQERQISLKSQLPSCPLKGRTDMEKAAYILREFIDNAIRFTPPGGAIEVECAPTSKPNGFLLRVADTGPGIPPEEQGVLFSVFRQSPSDQRLHKQKSGLGLPLVRHYVDLLKGSIELTSAAAGRPGCRFTVTVPWTE
ncbi:MAG: response regulator [Candidatus Omnitrophica bacterium]|nr:response regulator [Candidatus Omnitrophota bacterium]